MAADCSPILQCPDELLLDICSQLDRSSLYSLCLVHSRLRRVAEAYLYGEIEWTWDKLRVDSARLLFRTVVEQPGKGSLVRSLRLLGWDRFARGRVLLVNRETTEEEVILRKKTLDMAVAAVGSMGIESMSEDEQLTWTRDLGDGILDAWVTLLLTQLPELRNLRLEQDFSKDHEHMGMMFRRALTGRRSSSTPQWNHLKRVTLISAFEDSADWPVHDYKDLIPFFYLPSLEHIMLTMENPLHGPVEWPSTPPNPEALTSMHLKIARESALGEILSTMKNLKTLRWDWSWYPDHRGSDEPGALAAYDSNKVDLGKLTTGLLAVRKTLQKLVLTLDVCVNTMADGWLEVKCLGSLEGLDEMEKLTTLQAPLCFLAGDDYKDTSKVRPLVALPRNLERLWVAEDTWLPWEFDWESAYRRILGDWFVNHGAWRHSSPRLERLALLVTDDSDGFVGRSLKFEEEDPGCAATICEQAGLKYDYTWKEGNRDDQLGGRELPPSPARDSPTLPPLRF